MQAIISYSGYIHGLFNMVVILFFLYQAWLGFRIRRDRMTRTPASSATIRRHRNVGPVVSVAGVVGFLTGIAVVYLHDGHLLEQPVHFTLGLSITLVIVTVYFLSLKIRGYTSPWRTLHFAAGMLVLFLYFLQAFVGFEILFSPGVFTADSVPLGILF